MLPDGMNCLFGGYWWLVCPPAVILIVTVVGFNLVGGSLESVRQIGRHARLGRSDQHAGEMIPGRGNASSGFLSLFVRARAEGADRAGEDGEFDAVEGARIATDDEGR